MASRLAGQLITIEGVEGAGKSTQIERLADWLRGCGVPVTTTSEPDGTPLGAAVRGWLGSETPLDPLTECMLFAAARAEHVRRVIRPALQGGIAVLCDRFGDSTVAYQGYGRGVPLEVVDALNRVATDGLVPSLTLLLDLDVGRGLRRARQRAATLGAGLQGDPALDPFERLGLEFHERVRKGYRAIQEREPDRVELVDAGRPADAVAGSIRAIVAARFGLEPPE